MTPPPTGFPPLPVRTRIPAAVFAARVSECRAQFGWSQARAEAAVGYAHEVAAQ